MRLKFLENSAEIEVPSRYSELVEQISAQFNITQFTTDVRTSERTCQVASDTEYQNIPNEQIIEVEVFAVSAGQPDLLHLKKSDSINTCASNEKIDSAEFKHSEEVLKQVSETQTDKNIKESWTSMDADKAEKSDFEVQHDNQLIIDHDELKVFIKNLILELKTSKNTFVHGDFSCHKCKIHPIVGIRYECRRCKVNFCEKCEENTKHEHDLYVHKGTPVKSASVNAVNAVNSFSILNPASASNSVKSCSTFNPVSFDKKAFIQNLLDMGFEDVEKVTATAEKCRFDLNKTVSILLFD